MTDISGFFCQIFDLTEPEKDWLVYYLSYRPDYDKFELSDPVIKDALGDYSFWRPGSYEVHDNSISIWSNENVSEDPLLNLLVIFQRQFDYQNPIFVSIYYSFGASVWDVGGCAVMIYKSKTTYHSTYDWIVQQEAKIKKQKERRQKAIE